jgi:hypothetical protein
MIPKLPAGSAITIYQQGKHPTGGIILSALDISALLQPAALLMRKVAKSHKLAAVRQLLSISFSWGPRSHRQDNNVLIQTKAGLNGDVSSIISLELTKEYRIAHDFFPACQ